MPTWIRVRDDSTGHQYDVDIRSLRPGMTPIEGSERSGPNARPRRAKPLTDLAGNPTTPATPAAEGGRRRPATTTYTTPAQPAEPTKE